MSGERAARDVIERLGAAWNRRDWARFGDLFAEDASYVTGAGILLAGRRQIEAELSSRASQAPALDDVLLTPESVKLLAPHVALALCSWRLGEESRGRAGLLTVVIRDEGDGWRIMALHNTDRSD